MKSLKILLPVFLLFFVGYLFWHRIFFGLILEYFDLPLNVNPSDIFSSNRMIFGFTLVVIAIMILVLSKQAGITLKKLILYALIILTTGIISGMARIGFLERKVNYLNNITELNPMYIVSIDEVLFELFILLGIIIGFVISLFMSKIRTKRVN